MIGSGIGFATMVLFLSKGIKVYGVDWNMDRLEEFEKERKKLGKNDLFIEKVNIAEEKQVKESMEKCVKTFGKII